MILWLGSALIIFVFLVIGLVLYYSPGRITKSFGELFIGIACCLMFLFILMAPTIGLPH